MRLIYKVTWRRKRLLLLCDLGPLETEERTIQNQYSWSTLICVCTLLLHHSTSKISLRNKFLEDNIHLQCRVSHEGKPLPSHLFLEGSTQSWPLLSRVILILITQQGSTWFMLASAAEWCWYHTYLTIEIWCLTWS